MKIKGPDLIENDSLRLLLGDYYDKWVGYQFDLQEMSSQNFRLAKERQFEFFRSMSFWSEMKPVDYDSLVENVYYYSWLTFTEGERDWETKRFIALSKKNKQLRNLIEKEIEKYK